MKSRDGNPGRGRSVIAAVAAIAVGCVFFAGRPVRAALPAPLHPGLQTCLARLPGAGLEEQVRCLGRLRQAGPAAAVAVPALRDLLTRSDGATDHILLVSILDVFRSLGRRAEPAAETLSSLLPHRHKLYKDRDKALVVRLRSYILLTLSEIGFPSSAMPALLDSLVLVDEGIPSIEVGAAARAVRSLGPSGRRLAPYLLETLRLQLSVEEFSLERYDPLFPPHEATTVQLEAVRSLGQVCSPDDLQALAVLRQLAEAHGTGQDPRLAREARQSLDLILGRNPAK